MPIKLKYAMVAINNEPVLVEQKSFDIASAALKAGVNNSLAAAKLTEPDRNLWIEAGWALETPEGMKPLVLGDFRTFSQWAADAMKAEVTIEDEIKKLPPPFNKIIKFISEIQIVIYSASLFYIPGKDKAETRPADVKGLNGELVIGFRMPKKKKLQEDADQSGADFPLELLEIVIAINNYHPGSDQLPQAPTVANATRKKIKNK